MSHRRRGRYDDGEVMMTTALLNSPRPPLSSPARGMTADEFATFCLRPENVDRDFEMHDGKVIEMPRPTLIHGILQSILNYALMQYSEDKSVGTVVTESGLIITDDPLTLFGPDVAFYLNELDAKKNWADQPPLIAIEVRSPNDSTRRIVDKVDRYLAAGVANVWIVDGDREIVTIYRPDQPPLVVERHETLTCPALEGFAFQLTKLFKRTTKN
jgi:Uma2 family endonuclease